MQFGVKHIIGCSKSNGLFSFSSFLLSLSLSLSLGRIYMLTVVCAYEQKHANAKNQVVPVTFVRSCREDDDGSHDK
ncbi:hypothetical protein BDB00DRAFT_856500 [Zychaea mexicana]|uniref:uncharacterized protein n=1 Tax=Zychaea mexicana TaxID=64656 RepID=UPI0022FF0D84|nr:uncharacterized protein BDB00DRAFT_856500 [Zychaea mexicana]KAI9484314.1 hypothetical protein BDB00DRAFT_856500 [Zychaea mexicana]